MGEPRPVGQGSAAELARAKSLIEQQDFRTAVRLFEGLLEADLPLDLRSEVQTNLAAALCTLAQLDQFPESVRLAQLEQARVMLIETMLYYQPLERPRDWASARANLALVYLARNRLSDSDTDILQAHLALDGTEEALERVKDTELLGWIKAIRDHLLDLRDRRTIRRPGF